MKITLIEPQKKSGRYNIYIDNQYSFGIYEETLVNFGLKKNDELTEKKIKEIKDYDELNFGKKLAYKYLSYKQRTEQELRNKLQNSKISKKNIEKIIRFFREHNFINDESYVKSLIVSEVSKKPKGKKLLKAKLKQKGISEEIINSAISRYVSEDIEEANAKTLLEKYLKKIKKYPLEKQKQKSYRYLISRGFEYDTVSNILKEYFVSNME
ncbi:MAG: RecX family transcriptional regulator [Ignavibacteria bacterium]|nr:RecX family transcriptional regulator [Ignavibacteria bacterium]